MHRIVGRQCLGQGLGTLRRFYAFDRIRCELSVRGQPIEEAAPGGKLARDRTCIQALRMHLRGEFSDMEVCDGDDWRTPGERVGKFKQFDQIAAVIVYGMRCQFALAFQAIEIAVNMDSIDLDIHTGN
jgi:hypothetical protein